MDNGQVNLLQFRTTYKSFPRLLFNVLSVCLGSLFFGSALSYLSAFPIAQITNEFHIDLSDDNANGLLSGIIPVGAGIGAALSSLITKKFSRRNSLIFTAALSLVGSGLTQITHFSTLFVGRVIQGLCVGLYSAICPLVVKELSPIEISGRLGALNQLMIVAGIVMSDLLALAVDNNYKGTDPIWRIIFLVPAAIAIAQILLLTLVYRNQTPRYLLEIGQRTEARQLIEELYLPEYVEDVLRDREYEVKPKDSTVTQNGNQVAKVTSRLPIFIAFDLAILQQMCGVNVVVIYGGKILSAVSSNVVLVKWLNVLLISTQAIACFITSIILKKVGRKTLIQLGTLICIVTLAVIGTAFFLQKDSPIQSALVIGGLYVFMTTFGLTLGPVVWLYIPEVVPPGVVPYTTLANWVGASIAVILFPIIGGYLPNVGPLYYFFAVWCTVSLIINQKYMVETKDKTEEEIQRDYQKLA